MVLAPLVLAYSRMPLMELWLSAVRTNLVFLVKG